MVVKAKFPSLYTLVKQGDLQTLTQYFDAYPETSTTVELAAGRQLALIEQALVFGQTPIVQFLVDKTPPNQLNKIFGYFILDLKKNHTESANPNFNYLLERICNEIELTGSSQVKKILPDILITLCICGFVIHDKIITNLMANRLLDLANKLADPDFKWKFESSITSAPVRVYQLIIKFYQEHKIPLAQMLACFLLGANQKTVGIIKLFKSVDLKTPVNISQESNIQVQLSTLFVVSGAQAKLSDLLANPNFEHELIITIKNIEPEDYFSHLELSYIIHAYWSITHGAPSSVWSVVSSKTMGYLKLFESKLSNSFWNFLLELNEVVYSQSNKNEAKLLITQMIKPI